VVAGSLISLKINGLASQLLPVRTSLRTLGSYLNKSRPGLVARATDWPWSSVHAQLGHGDGMTITRPVRDRYPDFAALLAAGEEEAAVMRLRKAERIGRPIGDEAFLDRLETETGRALKRGKPGRRAEIRALSP
jgi:putative transposase